MDHSARFYTAEQVAARGLDDLPDELVSSRHLIYSSPATLAFNSPGAEGFGVKRAGLAIPGSVMLVVAPGCCGRNTSLVSSMPAYHDRFFYLNMDETDIVTGRHLRKIPQAVQEVVDGLPQRPQVVMICITCVDALLGTDMERVCRKAEERVGLPVRPCYMYALTREGRRPPMVHVRQSLYSLLDPLPKRATSVNLLGFFSTLSQDCELYSYLRGMGVKAIRQIAGCDSLEEFKLMAEANFNLVLHPEARFAADDLQRRLGIPSIELTRLYQIDRIHTQYQALGKVLGVSFDDQADYDQAQATVEAFRAAHPTATFAVGECLNGDAFEVALALVRYGFGVREVFGTVSAENHVFVRRLAELSPSTRIYSNMDPSMIHYDARQCPVEVALGKDAAWYHPDAVHLDWNQDVQPYGYAGVTALFQALADAWEARDAQSDAAVSGARASESLGEGTSGCEACSACAPMAAPSGAVRGLRRFLTPFAPDQSGAVSVLYELGGIVVICDAGGCTGNVCGFDEPRWHTARSAVFSAGLRDMDAILGRDDKLVGELVDASTKIDARFAAVVGTPVPSVIGTDYRALRRMSERRGTLPTITVDTTGMELYDVGAQKAYLALFDRFATEQLPVEPGRVGVLGANPLELSATTADVLRAAVPGAVCYGMGSTFDDVVNASSAERNLVVAPSGLAAAKLLQKRFGTPYEVCDPLADALIADADVAGRRVLVVHQQVCANSLRDVLLARGAKEVTCATWFMQLPELALPQDVQLREEADFVSLVQEGGYDLLIGDPTLWRMIPDYGGAAIDVPQFAVSGKLGEHQ